MGRTPLAAALAILLAGAPAPAGEAPAPEIRLPGYNKEKPPKAPERPDPSGPGLPEEERRELRDGVAPEPPRERPEPLPPEFQRDPFWLEHRKLVLDLRLETLETRLRDRTATRDELAAYREYSAERKRIKKLLKASPSAARPDRPDASPTPERRPPR